MLSGRVHRAETPIRKHPRGSHPQTPRRSVSRGRRRRSLGPRRPRAACSGRWAGEANSRRSTSCRQGSGRVCSAYRRSFLESFIPGSTLAANREFGRPKSRCLRSSTYLWMKREATRRQTAACVVIAFRLLANRSMFERSRPSHPRQTQPSKARCEAEKPARVTASVLFEVVRLSNEFQNRGEGSRAAPNGPTRVVA